MVKPKKKKPAKDEIPISNSTTKEPLRPHHYANTVFRPGALDYLKHPSLINNRRVYKHE